MTDISRQSTVKPWLSKIWRSPFRQQPVQSQARLKWAAAGALPVIFVAFGTMIANAGDDAGVHAFLRSQWQPAKARPAAPPLFVATANNRTFGHASPGHDRPSVVRQASRDAPPRITHQHAALTLSPLRKVSENGSAKISGLPRATRYCVRLCDGFFFPLSFSESDTGLSQATCSNLCPSSETRLFSAPAGSDSIDLASAQGVAYSSLPHAYAYRRQVSKSCTCTASGLGLNTPPIREDHTLRKGDLIATAKGSRTFSGQAPSLRRLSSAWSLEASVRAKVAANLDRLLGALQNPAPVRLERADNAPAQFQLTRLAVAKPGFTRIETQLVVALGDRGKIVPLEPSLAERGPASLR